MARRLAIPLFFPWGLGHGPDSQTQSNGNSAVDLLPRVFGRGAEGARSSPGINGILLLAAGKAARKGERSEGPINPFRTETSCVMIKIKVVKVVSSV